MKIAEIEERFKEVTGLVDLDLSTPHFAKGLGQQQKTTKEEYKEFGFVCTPLWLVDEMLEPQIPNITLSSRTCDACSGCGQFTIRLMRKFYNKLVGEGVPAEKAEMFMVGHWLRHNHFFTEFQFSNVAKLVYIFGPDINVYVGDTLDMGSSGDDDSGILFFNKGTGKWFNIPGLYDVIVPMKDDLDSLLSAFGALEGKLTS